MRTVSHSLVQAGGLIAGTFWRRPDRHSSGALSSVWAGHLAPTMPACRRCHQPTLRLSKAQRLFHVLLRVPSPDHHSRSNPAIIRPGRGDAAGDPGTTVEGGRGPAAGCRGWAGRRRGASGGAQPPEPPARSPRWCVPGPARPGRSVTPGGAFGDHNGSPQTICAVAHQDKHPLAARVGRNRRHEHGHFEPPPRSYEQGVTASSRPRGH
jgi:hypothetical protein